MITLSDMTWLARMVDAATGVRQEDADHQKTISIMSWGIHILVTM